MYTLITIIFKYLKRTSIKRYINKVVSIWLDLPFDIYSYYSPLPPMDKILANPKKYYKKINLKNINFLERKELINILNKIIPFLEESKSLEKEKINFSKLGQGYGEIESILLYSLIRFYKPKKVIEVGIGISTFYISKALERNNTESQSLSDHTCIDPYVTKSFKQYFHSLNLIEKKVQEVPLDLFNTLEDGDVLFIDSSHVAKLGSDVNFLILEVLPILKKGIIIHFHDIPFPYLTSPINNNHFFSSSHWNETALLKSFLDFNNNYQVLMSQSMMVLEQNILNDYVNNYDKNKHYPSSLWLRKIK